MRGHASARAATRPAARLRGALRDKRGVTILELMTALSLVAVAGAMSFGSFFQYQQRAAASRAARVIRADIQLTRALAIRARDAVSLVANESQRSYVVRDAAGTVYHRRDFGDGQEIELTGLRVSTTGDSLTFDARGILLTGGTPTINVARHATVRTVTVNAIGKTEVN